MNFYATSSAIGGRNEAQGVQRPKDRASAQVPIEIIAGAIRELPLQIAKLLWLRFEWTQRSKMLSSRAV